MRSERASGNVGTELSGAAHTGARTGGSVERYFAVGGERSAQSQEADGNAKILNPILIRKAEDQREADRRAPCKLATSDGSSAAGRFRTGGLARLDHTPVVRPSPEKLVDQYLAAHEHVVHGKGDLPRTAQLGQEKKQLQRDLQHRMFSASLSAEDQAERLAQVAKARRRSSLDLEPRPRIG